MARRAFLAVAFTLIAAACKRNEPHQERSPGSSPTLAPALLPSAQTPAATAAARAATPPAGPASAPSPPAAPEHTSPLRTEPAPEPARWGNVTATARIIEDALAPYCGIRIAVPELSGLPNEERQLELNTKLLAELEALRKALFDDSPCTGASEELPFGFEATYQVGAKRDDYVALELRANAYTGGAHPNGLTRCFVVSLGDVRLLQLEPHLTPLGRSKLAALTGQRLAEQHGVKRLTEAGFFVNEIRIQNPGGVCLTEEGISVLFQQYEVAPYALGVPTVDFHLDEVRSFFDSKALGVLFQGP